MNAVKKIASTRQQRTAAPAPKSTACAPWRQPRANSASAPEKNTNRFFRSRAKCTSASIAAAIFLAMVPGAGRAAIVNLDSSYDTYYGNRGASDTITIGAFDDYGNSVFGTTMDNIITSDPTLGNTIINNHAGVSGDPNYAEQMGDITGIFTETTISGTPAAATITNGGSSITTSAQTNTRAIYGTLSSIVFYGTAFGSDVTYTFINKGNTIENGQGTNEIYGSSVGVTTCNNTGYGAKVDITATDNTITNDTGAEVGDTLYGSYIGEGGSILYANEQLSITASIGGNTIINNGRVGNMTSSGFDPYVNVGGKPGEISGSYSDTNYDIGGPSIPAASNTSTVFNVTGNDNTVENNGTVGGVISGATVTHIYNTYFTVTTASISNTITSSNNTVTNAGEVGRQDGLTGHIYNDYLYTNGLGTGNIYGAYNTATYNTGNYETDWSDNHEVWDNNQVVTVSGGGMTQIVSQGNTVTNTGTVLDWGATSGDTVTPSANGGNVYGSYSFITINTTYIGLSSDITSGGNTVDNSGLIQGVLAGSYSSLNDANPDNTQTVNSSCKCTSKSLVKNFSGCLVV